MFSKFLRGLLMGCIVISVRCNSDVPKPKPPLKKVVPAPTPAQPYDPLRYQRPPNRPHPVEPNDPLRYPGPDNERPINR